MLPHPVVDVHVVVHVVEMEQKLPATTLPISPSIGDKAGYRVYPALFIGLIN